MNGQSFSTLERLDNKNLPQNFHLKILFAGSFKSQLFFPTVLIVSLIILHIYAESCNFQREKKGEKRKI